jgi:endoglucanase
MRLKAVVEKKPYKDHWDECGTQKKPYLIGLGLGFTLMLSSCGTSGGRRGLGSPQSETTSLKIGSLGGDWFKMEVAFDSITKKNPFQKYGFEKKEFSSNSVENVNIVVKQDEYYIDLGYFDSQNKLVMQSCPEAKKTKHNMVGQKEYKTSVDVCPVNSDKPVGTIDISGEPSNVTITPVPKSGDQKPNDNSSPKSPINPNQPPQFSSSKIPKNARFWVDPYSQAMNSAQNLRSKGDSRASAVEFIAKQGAAVWYGEWSGTDIRQAVSRQVQGARETGTWAVMIAYYIPYRDCGQHSAGGLKADEYRRWISDFASGIGDANAIVILEPDAIPLQRCLTEELKKERAELLKEAVQKLKANKNTIVYLDAGHPKFLTVGDLVPRLRASGIDQADGFALNTSNYQTTESNVSYGTEVSQLLGGKNFVIDTSRNGNGPQGDQWCNPRGRALGRLPTADTGVTGVDAFLWLKRAGESDGFCENGGDDHPKRYDVPAAGAWWLDIAVEQARNAGIK